MSGHGDVGLVAVLLEKHPLQRPGPLQIVLRKQCCAGRKIEQNRIRLTEYIAAIELQRGNLAVRILCEILRGARLAAIGVELDTLEGQSQMGEQEPRLVGIARVLVVKKSQQPVSLLSSPGSELLQSSHRLAEAPAQSEI